MNIINIFNQTPCTTSIVIADALGRSHLITIRLVRQHLVTLEQFGEVNFKSLLNPQGSDTEYAILNEDQATLLITMFRNTKIVIDFKVALVKAFSEAKKEIQRLSQENSLLRVALQLKRDAHNPMIQELTEQRLIQGKVTEHHHCMNESKLCNSILTGLYSGLDENLLDKDYATFLERVRVMNTGLLASGLDYQTRKEILINFGSTYRIRNNLELI